MITDDEFKKLFSRANRAFKDVLVCGWESAMRSGEIIDLRARQVHLNVKHISGEVLDFIDLGIFDTKTKARRTVPISPRLKEVLERRLVELDTDDPVFTNLQGQKYSCAQSISSLFRDVCTATGVPHGDKLLNDKGERIGIVFHCLRHTRTTKWVESGYSDEIIRRATGHASLEAYRKYVNITDAKPIMNLIRNQNETKNQKTDKTGTKSIGGYDG